MNTRMNMRSILSTAVLTLIALVVTVEGHALSSRSATGHELSIGVREVAMLSNAGPDTLVLDAASDFHGTMLLQYTTVNSVGAHRTISVSWNRGERAPAGTSLRMRALSVPEGCGQTRPEIVVSEHPDVVIDRIPSCATGRGDRGALLEYRLSIDDAARLDPRESTTVNLVFTISDDS